jgi:hypothetical protein
MVSRGNTVIATPLATFNETYWMSAFSAPVRRSNVINKVSVTIHPRRVDAAATTVLATAQGTPSLAPGETAIWTAVYTDPAARAIRVGGTAMVTPVATTDYTFNAQADGLGADLTASVAVSAEYGANTVEWTATNGSGSTAYRTKLQCRGKGIYDYDPIDVRSLNQESIDAYGLHEYPGGIDLPYESDQNTGQAIADFIVATWSRPSAVGASFAFDGTDAYTLAWALTLDVGDCISVAEQVTSGSGDLGGIPEPYAYRIMHVRRTITRSRWLAVEYTLARVRVGDYWELGTAGKGELGETTFLAPS